MKILHILALIALSASSAIFHVEKELDPTNAIKVLEDKGFSIDRITCIQGKGCDIVTNATEKKDPTAYLGELPIDIGPAAKIAAAQAVISTSTMAGLVSKLNAGAITSEELATLVKAASAK